MALKCLQELLLKTLVSTGVRPKASYAANPFPPLGVRSFFCLKEFNIIHSVH